MDWYAILINMARLIPDYTDYGVPYKTFKEIQQNDILYLIDIENFIYSELIVKEIKIEDVSSNYSGLNKFMVTYKVENKDHADEIVVYNGNSFIHIDKDSVVCTDLRIVNSIIEILQNRNSIQWNKFISIFGNPMKRYAETSISLG
jgi:hypothetical protein